MMLRMAVMTALTLAACSAATHATDPRYPDWPCAQAKVPVVSLAAVWAGPPLDDVREKWKDDAKVNALVARLSARKTPLDEAEKAVKEFLAKNPSKKSNNAKQQNAE